MSEAARGIIVVLSRDAFFGIRIDQLARALGFRAELVKETTAFFDRLAELGDRAALGVIAIGVGVDWGLAAERLRAAGDAGAPIIAFGPHRDVEGLRAAKAAGVRRVFSNQQFHAEMAPILERYARPVPAGPEGAAPVA